MPPRMDINAPDLYIPIMAFTTYVLVSGIVLGTQGRYFFLGCFVDIMQQNFALVFHETKFQFPAAFLTCLNL